MLTDSKYEMEFEGSAAVMLHDLGVEVVRVHENHTARTLDVVMCTKGGATTRRAALGILSDFEHRFDYDVVTDPTFIWDGDDTDD